ncbi:LytR/AlgR family response regulator transcription factor [Aureitalea marina]|uniref:DNA-binding response regulator n=1 Tax=Aureitalea marina TaxID=930804 RepID=A0A2S7KSB4_9FLAO|nr:LytTR family DNA-binding domain-containing protein [Aureitalea marina]PQB05443.1 hypothetical protein BST85_11485 [Aureitalea marina]
MGLSCQIIEDDSRMATEIKEIIASHFPDISVFNTIDTTEGAKAALQNRKPDILISDINLGDGEIFSVLEQLMPVSFKIIFITAYSKHAVRAFRFSALSFLEKPFAEEELVEAFQMALDQIDQQDYNQMLQVFYQHYNQQVGSQKLVLKNLEAVHIVKTEDILFLKSDNNYTEFYINDGRKIIVSRALRSFEKDLPKSDFFRTHQSYLVNLDHAKLFHKKDSVLELVNGAQVTVSGRKSQLLVERLSS